MSRFIAALLFSALLIPLSYAVSCGSVAVPTTCTVSVANKVKYTFSGFSLANSTAAGGGNLYVAADIGIDVASGGGNTGLLTFNKITGSPTVGVVFLANAGNTSGIVVTYNVTIEPLGFAGVMFGSPFTVSLVQQSHLGTGTGSVQFIPTSGVSCQAIALSGSTQSNCVVPGGQPVTLSAGYILSMSGNTGNVSIGSFSNLYSVATAAGQGLDIDGNGSYDALTDGLLVVRYMLGIRGAALINGAVGASPTRSSVSTIEAYLNGLSPP